VSKVGCGSLGICCSDNYERNIDFSLFHMFNIWEDLPVVETHVSEHVVVIQQVLMLEQVDLVQELSLDDPADALALLQVLVLVGGHVSLW
jgi:hypothetical protein